MKTSFVLSILCLAQLVAKAQLQATTFNNDPIAIKQYTLANGLTVILSENHNSPKAFGAVVVKTGGKKDPKDNTGMAHYLEHMLFKGTEDLGTIDYEKEKPLQEKINQLYDELAKTQDPIKRQALQKEINAVSVEAAAYAIPNEMDRMLSEIGGEDVNAFTTEEITAYHNSFPGNQIYKWLAIYAHRFENPVFRLFQSELETVYEEKNMGMDNPISYVFEKYIEQFYKVHPYGQQTVIGKTEHLKNPSLTAMYNYYNTYYVANNMALIISGDFDSEKIIPFIEKTFGKWRSAPVPEFPNYKEADFVGREFFKLRATPIKIGAIGYRVPPNTSKEIGKLLVCLSIISNEEGAGLLDELSTDGKLMSAFQYPLLNNDYGAVIIGFIPKLIGQSLKKAEKLVLSKVNAVAKGDFSNELLAASKKNLMKQFEYNWESNESRVMVLMETFSQGQSWGDFIELKKNIASISKDEIIEFAKKYFAENRLVLYSKMGFPKKDKLDKPGFDPVIPTEERHSEYYERWKQHEALITVPKYVNFDKDIFSYSLSNQIHVKSTKNPFNAIGKIQFRFGSGKYYLRNLKFAPEYIAMASSKTYTASALNRKLYELGCEYYCSVTEEEFLVSITGFDDQLAYASQLIFDHLKTLTADDKKVKEIRHNTEAELKLSKREPSFLSSVLNQHILYGDNSAYHREISVKEMKDLKANQIIDDLKEAMKYELRVNYVGNLDSSQINACITHNFNSDVMRLDKKEKINFNYQSITENTVYIYPFKKALQSQINFFIVGKNFSLEDAAKIEAFNRYFGGDMSSLVFQEIREFRSLAYSCYGNYSAARKVGLSNLFVAYIACQSDKTMDAVEAMNDLIRNMPQKSERWSGIQSSLIETAKSNRPNFKDLIPIVDAWRYKGYGSDPNELLVKSYEQMDFNAIVELWEQELKSPAMAITIVGNPDRMNLEAMKKFGKIVYLKEADIMKE